MINVEAFGEGGGEEKERERCGRERERIEIFGNECPHLQVEGENGEKSGQRSWTKIEIIICQGGYIKIIIRRQC